MKKNSLEVFHLFGNTSCSRMSDELIYKIMDNISFNQIKKSILHEIEDYEKIIRNFPEHDQLFSDAIEKDKKILLELEDHFEWIIK